jgi:hypothetical protein
VESAVLGREVFDAPGAGPAGGAKRGDDAGQVEGAFAAIAAPVHGVLEQRADGFAVGVVELHADDSVQRERDDPAGGVAGVFDQPQRVLDGPDVGPGEELDAEACPGIGGLCGEQGELGGPGSRFPRRPAGVGRHLEVAGAERLGGGQQEPAQLVRSRPLGAAAPSVRQAIQLQVDDAVVRQHRADPGPGVLPFGDGEVDGENPEAGEPAAVAASIRSRSGTWLRQSSRDGAASPAVVQHLASRSSAAVTSSVAAPGCRGRAVRVRWCAVGPGR